MEIRIDIRDKVPRLLGDYTIICGNSDYNILFTFDDEWDEYETKTVRFGFSQGEDRVYIEKEFKGSTCEVPILSDIKSVEIGVYAGNIHTTTPCLIRCKRSILCGGAVPTTPSCDAKESLINKVQEISENSTEDQYPSAKAVHERIVGIMIGTSNIENSAVTLNKVDQYFFKDGIRTGPGEDIELVLTQQVPAKHIFLTAHLKNKTDEITEESTDEIPTAQAVYNFVNQFGSVGGIKYVDGTVYINELETGIYRCSIDTGSEVLFDHNPEYGLIDGILMVSHMPESLHWYWLAIGTDYSSWVECIRIGASVVTEDMGLVIEDVKTLNSVITEEDAIQHINVNKTYGGGQFYSANALNQELLPLLLNCGYLEVVSNRATEIDPDFPDKYPTVKAVYDFGCIILSEVEKMLGNVNISQLTAEAITAFTMNTSAEVDNNAE